MRGEDARGKDVYRKDATQKYLEPGAGALCEAQVTHEVVLRG